MPLYEYECEKCGERFEKIEKFTAPHTKTCPKCGGKAERRLAPSAIQFKGSGWYVTDYARKGEASVAGGEKKDSKEPAETKEAKGAKEPAPAKEPAKKARKEK